MTSGTNWTCLVLACTGMPLCRINFNHVAPKMALSFGDVSHCHGAELAGSDALATKKKGVTASQELY